MKTHTDIALERVRLTVRNRFNPIRGLDTESLTRQLDAFKNGYLREVAQTWDAIEERDDLVKAVASKRKKAVARHGWEVLMAEDSATARAHQQALEYFYNNLVCTNALDANERGGFKLLARQMMDAVGKRYAVHEIIWRPQITPPPDVGAYKTPSHVGAYNPPSHVGAYNPPPHVGAYNPPPHVGAYNRPDVGAYNRPDVGAYNRPDVGAYKTEPAGAAGKLTAEFRFVPLWFFENTQGRLRYLEGDYALTGSELDEGGWMVTVGDGIMMACAVAYMFKQLPLKDWLTYCQRHGMPGICGVTSADLGSAQWDAMVEAVRNFTADTTAVMKTGDALEVIELGGKGELPYPRLIEEMNRAMATLWRGGDLSTRSLRYGTGASLQSEETAVLEEDDCEWISETLNAYVDRWVIRYAFGEHAVPRAYIRILPPPKQDVDRDLKVDEFLLRHGARLAVCDTLERYGRTAAEEGETVVGEGGEGGEGGEEGSVISHQ